MPPSRQARCCVELVVRHAHAELAGDLAQLVRGRQPAGSPSGMVVPPLSRVRRRVPTNSCTRADRRARPGGISRVIRPRWISRTRSDRPWMKSRFCSTSRRSGRGCLQPRMRSTDRLDDRGLDALGRLVQQDQLRLAAEARGPAPATAARRPRARRPAGRAAASAREVRRGLLDDRASAPPCADDGAMRRLSSTDRPGKICRPCGT